MTVLHERWFVDSSPFPVSWTSVTRPGTLVATGGALVVFGLAFLLWRRTGRRPLVPGPFRLGADADSLAVLYGAIPLVLALHLSITLFVSGVNLQLFAPNLRLGEGGPVPIGSMAGAIAALAQIGIGLALFYGALTRFAALALVALWVGGVFHFGPLLLLEHAIVPGTALTLAITGRGPFAVDALLNPRLGLPRLRRLPHALTPLRIGTGISLVTLAFTEKLANLPLGLAFLERYPVNFLAAWGLPVSDETFLLVAGAVELLIGLLLIGNVFTRLGIVLLWLPFNLTLAAFGWIEVVGHLPVYGAMAVLALWGAGSAEDLRALQRGLMQRPALLPREPAPPHEGTA
ncbi:MAG TPA: hypothetical protein VFU00_00020 [Gemmatimonadales bacterium]|nr:hypothetical protein [Gemmatimonadales bacterium]